MNTENTNTTHKSSNSLIERLFKSGAHFGFTKSRRHPTTVPYLFGNKQGTDIIDLEKTSASIDKAKEVLTRLGKEGKTVLVVGTKEEISKCVKQSTETLSLPFVTNRWIGGMLTNFPEMKKRIARLQELVAQGESGELERKYTKKERVVIGRELEKLVFNFDSIKSMDRLPDALLVVDPRHDAIAVKEAVFMKIPIIGVGSSDTNLREVTYPIVINDALQSSVELVLRELMEAYKTGKLEYVPPVRKEDGRRPQRRG